MEPDSLPPTFAVDALVVGAGITGLRCADGLVRRGLKVLVLEARDRVGGRLWSPASGGAGDFAAELGATWFWPQEPRINALVRELELPTHEQHRRGDAIYEDHRGIQRLAGNPVDGVSGRFSWGAQQVARALARRLPEGTLRTSCPVTGISVAGDGVEVDTPRGPVRALQVVVALPPALAVSSILFRPSLPEPLARIARDTPVWMGGTAKVVVVYGAPFWRNRGLAGAAISHWGPLREIHDMSGPEGEPAALFGFAAPPAGLVRTDLAQTPAQTDTAARTDSGELPGGVEPLTEEAVLRQLTRLFGPEAGRPRSLRIADWSRERWTTPADPGPGTPPAPRYDLYGHPAFQRPIHGRIHLASTETALAFAGHIEGALLAADETVGRVVEVGGSP